MEEIPGFGRHVRLISGASGGMVGMSYYIASLLQGGGQLQRDWIEKINTNTIGSIVRHLCLRSFWKIFIPLRSDEDSGVTLERQWAGIVETSLRSCRDLERRGRIPSVVFSPMIAQTGRQMLISNLILVVSSNPEARGNPGVRGVFQTLPRLGNFSGACGSNQRYVSVSITGLSPRHRAKGSFSWMLDTMTTTALSWRATG